MIFLEKILDTFNIRVIFIMIAAGIIGVLVDGRAMGREGFKREALVARYSGIFYILFGIVLIILTILT